MDDDHSYYPASTSKAPPPRPKAPPKKPKAPRPANAWILFRSEQARFIPKGPGAPQQSEVSKVISQMWKDASTEVREEYERRADLKKQEHAKKYPDYRFQPIKKEDKERLKEEKKAEREASRGPSRRTRTSHRYTPYSSARASTPTTPASTFHDPLQSYYPNAVNYQMHGMYGPTPPMSAASSPESVDDDSNLPETPVESESDSQLSLPSINDSQDYSTSPEELLPHAFDDFAFTEFQQQQPVEQAAYPTAPTPVDEWNFDPQAVNPGYLMLNVPASAVPESQSWATPIPEFDESLQGLMTNTDNPSIFTLTGFDPDTIQTNPQGAINLSVNDYTFDVSLFEGFDFSSVPGLESFDRVYSNGSNASSFDMEQYLNLDPASAIDPSFIPQMPLSQALPSPAPTEPPAPSPYQPPAGAAFASTRRVGGTWRPYRDQSPDAASPLPYGVPAN